MSALPATNVPAVQAPSKLIVKDESPVAYIMDTARFEHSNRIATMMAFCHFMPDHLLKDKNKNMLPEKEAVANCMLVLAQAMRWQMDPYNVAGETYAIGGKLSYQGKLIAAVVNARGKLAAPLDAIYSNGKGDDLAAVIFGSKNVIPAAAKDLLRRYANQEDRDALTELKFMQVMAIRLTVGQCKTNNQMWTKDPEQKLFYTGATKWARRFCPELMLGVLTDDDFDRMSAGSDIPVPSSLLPEPIRTLSDLDKAVAPNATITVPTQPEPPKPPVEDDPIDVTAQETHLPAWALAHLDEIREAKKFSILQPLGGDLIKGFRNPEMSENAKETIYPILFSEWVKASIKLCPASGKPQLLAIIDGWKQYLPQTITDALAELT